mgnify:CR=1 FL=1
MRFMPIVQPSFSLQLLTAGLRGHPPPEAQWPSVLKVASRSWLSPALYVALARSSRLDEAPADVRDYLDFLHERNRERNRRLREQLVEAVGALNAQGIELILLKGAVHLFCAPAEILGARMMSDLDLSVEPEEMVQARSALERLGYRDVGDTRGMGRSGAVALIEMRDRPSKRVRRYLLRDLRAASYSVEQVGTVARVPNSTCRAIHLIVHDMIKEGDYWRWRMDLRHLHDLAELASAAEGIDWHQIAATLSDRIGRGALEIQATALHHLFDVPTPPELRGGMARLVHVGRVFSGAGGVIGASVRVAGNIRWGFQKLTTAHAYQWQGGRDFIQRACRVLLEPPKGSRL